MYQEHVRPYAPLDVPLYAKPWQEYAAIRTNYEKILERFKTLRDVSETLKPEVLQRREDDLRRWGFGLYSWMVDFQERIYVSDAEVNFRIGDLHDLESKLVKLLKPKTSELPREALVGCGSIIGLSEE